eukprot:4108668-Amphidinium_carterae.1
MALLTRLQELAPRLRVRHAVLALTGLAKARPLTLECRVPKTVAKALSALLVRLQEVVHDLDPQDVALVLWAITTLGS